MTSKPEYIHVNPAFNLRLPPELKLELAAEAKKKGRSLNSEINYRLRESLRPKYR
jgi:predicted HicB family RNase H-like nuclease